MCGEECSDNQYKRVSTCACEDCAGRDNRDPDEKCLTCDANDCTKCALGYGVHNGGCVKCPVGTYSDGTTDCLPCEEGTYQTEEGWAEVSAIKPARVSSLLNISITNTWMYEGGNPANGWAHITSCRKL